MDIGNCTKTKICRTCHTAVDTSVDKHLQIHLRTDEHAKGLRDGVESWKSWSDANVLALPHTEKHGLYRSPNRLICTSCESVLDHNVSSAKIHLNTQVHMKNTGQIESVEAML